MTHTPANVAAARRLLANIERDVTARLRRTKDGDPLAVLFARCREVVAMGLVPGRADGYPSTTPLNGSPGGGSGGGRHFIVIDEHGQPDRVPITSTEQAAIANPVRGADPVGNIARQVLAELAALHGALDGLEHALNRYDRERRMQGVGPDAPQCHVAAVVHKLPWDHEWEPMQRRTTLGGLFDEPRQVCGFVYNFHQRARRLPSRAEMLRHLERGSVMVNA